MGEHHMATVRDKNWVAQKKKARWDVEDSAVEQTWLVPGLCTRPNHV